MLYQLVARRLKPEHGVPAFVRRGVVLVKVPDDGVLAESLRALCTVQGLKLLQNPDVGGGIDRGALGYEVLVEGATRVEEQDVPGNDRFANSVRRLRQGFCCSCVHEFLLGLLPLGLRRRLGPFLRPLLALLLALG